MIISRRLALTVLLGIFGSCVLIAQTTSVRVRLIYLKNGKPAKGQQIILYEGDPQHMSAAEWRSQSKAPRETTSAVGVAIFRIPEPPPKTVWVNVGNGRITACASAPESTLEDVMKQGVTIGVDERFGASCKGDRGAIKRLAAKPGEIVMFVRNLGFFEKMQE